MAAGAITIGLEKFMLAPNLEGSINHQPLTVFRDQYGVDMTDTATLDLFKRVFASGLTKDARAERITQLTPEQKERILVALNKRLGLFTRHLATLQNTTLENKRVALNKLIHDITRAGAKSPAPGPGAGTSTTPAVVLNEIVETIASPENTPEVAQEKKTKRANFLQRILIIAYYLANPSKLRALDQSVYNAMSDLVAGLNGVKTPSQLTNILALVQAGAKAEDVRALDPLNYFEMISMPGFLESPDLETGVQNKVITPLTNESLLSSYITKLMGLLAIQGTVDEERIKALKECLKGEGACIDKGRKAKGEELGVKLTSAIEPLYETFRKMYSPVFMQIANAMITMQPKPFDPIMKMVKLFANIAAKPDEHIPEGVYKYTDVPNDLIKFIDTLQQSVAPDRRRLHIGSIKQYIFLRKSLPTIPTAVDSMELDKITKVTETPASVGTGAQPKSAMKKQPAVKKSEINKSAILDIVTRFFADTPNTVYIISGTELTTTKFKLFTASATTNTYEEFTTGGYTIPNEVQIVHILPTIGNRTLRKPLYMGELMLAGFIAFKQNIAEMTKEPDAPVAAPPPPPPPEP